MLAVIERKVISTEPEFGLGARHDLGGWQNFGMMHGVNAGGDVVDGFLDEPGKRCALHLEVAGGSLARVVDDGMVVGTENAVVPVADWRGDFWEGTPDD